MFQLTPLLLVILMSLQALGGPGDEGLDLQMSLYDFAPTGVFDRAQVTHYKIIPNNYFEVSSNGGVKRVENYRFETQEVVLLGEVASTLERGVQGKSIVADLQKEALLEMLRDGYINRQMYDALIDGVGLWEPEQIQYAVLWSEVSLAKARLIFKDEGIPWDRVIGGEGEPAREPEKHEWSAARLEAWEKCWPENRPLRIARASVMMVQGQIINPLTGEISPLPMAWEADHPSLGGVNRKTFPLTAEVSRARSESGLLKGSFVLPLKLLLHSLNEDSKLVGVDPKHYGMFARSLERRHTIRFTKGFGMRPYSVDLARWFDLDFENALSNYQTAISSKAPEGDIVVFSTLAQGIERLPVSGLSQRDYQTITASKAKVNWEFAAELRDHKTRHVWAHFLFPEQEAPISILDRSILPASFMASELLEVGIDDSQAANDVIRHFGDMGHWELSVYWHYWREVGYVLPKGAEYGSPLDNNKLQFIRIDNIDEAVAVKNPDFVAKVLWTVYQSYIRKLNESKPLVLENIIFTLQQVLKNPPLWVSNPDSVGLIEAEWIFNEIPFMVATTSPLVRDKLVELGGKLQDSESILQPQLNVLHRSTSVEVQTQALPRRKGFLVTFKASDLEKLASRFLRVELPCPESMARFALFQQKNHI